MWQSASTTSYSALRYRPLLTSVSVYGSRRARGGATAGDMTARQWLEDCGVRRLLEDCAWSISAASRRRARVLGDLGAVVVRVVPPAGDVLDRQRRPRVERGQAGRVRSPPTIPRSTRCSAPPTSCSTRPAPPGTHELDPGARAGRGVGEHHAVRARRPARVVARVRPRGHGGEREHVRTGDPDRAPVRCTEPAAYAHTGREAAFAALTALWSGIPQRVDVSMQEVVLVANMVAPANFPRRASAAAGAARASAAPARSGPRSTASSRSGCAAARRASRASRP